MSIGENAPSASDSVGRGEEWNMESPQEQEVNEAEVDSPEEGDEDAPYMSDREKIAYYKKNPDAYQKDMHQGLTFHVRSMMPDPRPGSRLLTSSLSSYSP